MHNCFPTFSLLVAQVFQDEIEVLLNSRILQGVLDQKLDENTLAQASYLFLTVAHHHFLDSFHEVINIAAHEFLVDYSPQAGQNVALN